ncbi:MAG: oleoyl-(acyl-carrier-protein) hydrolase [Eubacterium sp.]|nr:oleoyl-(acyl-carrier-protein) hydrolase [Eubacterium sp.]
MNKIKLFCIPYAGGSAVTYSRWKNKLNRSIELQPVELSGRGSRLGQVLHHSMSSMVDDVYDVIKDRLNAQPYALFGYSMGSWIAFELAKKLEQHKHQKPVHIFFSAMEAPHIIKKDGLTIHELPDVQFKSEIAKLGGTSRQILENEELFNLFLPILRADYSVFETYKFIEGNNMLGCDISVLYGKHDTIPLQDIFEWKMYSNGKCKLYEFDNGHFFINDESEKIIDIVNSTLAHTSHLDFLGGMTEWKISY